MELFEPYELGPLRLRNRVVGAPMERNLCTLDGRLTERYLTYLRARARGGVGLLFAEAAYVRADGKGRRRQLGVHDAAVVPGLARAADAVHAEGGLLGVELNHGGRTAQSRVSGLPPVAPSPVPCDVAGGERPRELTPTEIEALVAAYAAAAVRCAQAGVDALTIHAAHGYLIHQFMSPRTNLRTDAYGDGGRFLAEVIEAVRAAAPEVALGLRISAFEGTPDGLDADATFALVAAAPLHRLDFLDVSAGSYEAGQWTIQPGEWPEGLLGDHAARYRQLGLPTVVAGRITRVDTARRLLAGGSADLVAVARALHADPAWARRSAAGESPRPCIACNACIDGLGGGEPIPCSVNPALGHAEELDDAGRIPAPTSTSTSRRVVVVGGGPAGLEAALTLAAHGNAVTLHERQQQLGGELRLAAVLRCNPEFGRLLDWYERRLRELGVELRLGSEVEPGELSADAVIVASGRPPLEHGLAGAGPGGAAAAAGGGRVLDVRDWLRAGGPDLGDAVHLVWGADGPGVAVADELVARGRRVLLVGAEAELAPEVGRRAKILVVPRLQRHANVAIELRTTVARVEPGRVELVGARGRRWIVHDGPVLVSQGTGAPRAGHPLAAGTAAGSGATIAAAIAGGREAARALDAALAGREAGAVAAATPLR